MPSLDELNLESDLKAVLDHPLSQRCRVERVALLEVVVQVSSARAPKEVFQARLAWAKYPSQPPSLKFRDPGTGRLDIATAWPNCRGFRPQSLDACVNWCAEGFALHPEWCSDPKWRWDPTGNPLLRTIETLQFEMDEFFEGRFTS